MRFRFGARRRKPLTAKGLIVLGLVFGIAAYRSMNRHLAQSQAWEGVIQSKEQAYNWEELSFYKHGSTGFGLRPYVTVRCDDGQVRTAQVPSGLYDLLNPGDRVVKPGGEKYAKKVR